MFQTTRELDAHYYLDDSGSELTRDDVLAAVRDDTLYGQNVYMVYVGGGYCPLTFAVLAYDESSAVSTMEEWCIKNGRQEELGEAEEDMEDDYWGEYELTIETVPASVLVSLI